MPESTGLSDIIIGDRLNFANQRRLMGVSGLNVSWELSYAGQLSCELPLLDLRQLGFQPLEMLAKWVYYEHPTAGPWGGVITNVSGSGSGLIAINAESWAAELKGVPTTRTMAPSFNLVSELKRQLDLTRGDTGIQLGVFDVGSTNVSIADWPIEDGQDMYDSFLPEVVSRWEQANADYWFIMQPYGWNIDPQTRRFSFDTTYGQNLTRSVLLADGLHNTASEFSDDLADIVNRVFLTGVTNYEYTSSVPYRNERGQIRYQQIVHSGTMTRHAVATNEQSRERYGLRSLTFQEDHASASAVDAAALRRVRWLSRLERPVTIETADVGGVWRKFREGDVVTIVLGNSGVHGQMVVRHRSLDVARGTMRVTGEAELS